MANGSSRSRVLHHPAREGVREWYNVRRSQRARSPSWLESARHAPPGITAETSGDQGAVAMMGITHGREGRLERVSTERREQETRPRPNKDLPDHVKYRESRWLRSCSREREVEQLVLPECMREISADPGLFTPIGTVALRLDNGVMLGCETCEVRWTPRAPYLNM